MLEVRADFNGLLSWLQAKGQAIPVYKTRLFEESERIMREELFATTPVKTGNLRSKITSYMTPSGVAVYIPDKRVPWLERGTRPHEIKPKTAKALHFFIDGGMFQTVFGKEIFAKRVMHPGFPGRFFIREAHERSRMKIHALITEIMDEVMQNA